MANAVGLAASIVGILQLAATTTSLSYGYFGSVKNAPETAKNFMDELGSLTRVLTTLEGCVQANPGSAVLKELEEPVRKCVQEMQDISKKLDPAKKGWLKKKLARYKWPLKEAETLEYIKRLERHKSFFIIVLNADALARSKAIGTDVEEVMADVKDIKISVVDQKMRAAKNLVHTKRNEILEWLSPDIFDTKHNEISSRRQNDTGDWLLRRPEFQDWTKKSPNSLLFWGYGIPGSGKTFLSMVSAGKFRVVSGLFFNYSVIKQSYSRKTRTASIKANLFSYGKLDIYLTRNPGFSSRVIDHLFNQATGVSYGVAYFYFDYKERDQQKPAQVIACLTKQLLCQTRSSIPKEIEEQYKKFDSEKKTPTLQDQYNILLIAAKSFAQTFIICDALDECDQKTQRRELLPLFHRLGKAGINLFLTSREYPADIQDSLQNSLRVRILAHEEDITSYVERKIEENPRARRLVNQGKCKEKITNGLIECAKGMFLLVHFHIEYLCQQTTVREILTELERLKHASNEENPLGPTYDRAMESIRVQPKNCVGLAHKVLTWLFKAQRVLKVSELQLAVSVEQDRTSLHEFDLPDKKTLLEICASLVTIDDQSDTIRFAHYTVQEYLFKNSIIPTDADFRVAMACTTFLSFDVFAHGACTSNSSLDARHSQHPFLKYAADHLCPHIQNCDETLSTELVLRFLKRPGCILSYQQALLNMCEPSYYGENRFNEYPKGVTPLHIAAYLGHYTVVQLLLKEIDVVDRKNDMGLTALHEASGQGHEKVVRLLLENGADPSAVYEEYQRRQTPLSLAVRKGFKEIVLLLLEKGAKTSLEGHTPLMCLAKEESMIRLLFGKGIDLEEKDDTDDGRTALVHAMKDRNYECTRVLVELGADCLTPWEGMPPIILAVLAGMKYTRLLLENGADILARDSEETTVLHASSFVDEDILKYVVNEGADINAQDANGMTALHFAIAFKRDSTIRFLLEKGADPTAKEYVKGWSALQGALNEAHKPCIELLLEGGAEAELHVTDKDGSTLLHVAVDGIGSEDKRESIVRFFLKKGIDPSVVNNNGDTALEIAKRRGYTSIIRTLEVAMHEHVEMTEE